MGRVHDEDDGQRTRERLRRYETQYGMPSNVFYQRWLNDSDGMDSFDFNFWTALYSALQDIERRRYEDGLRALARHASAPDATRTPSLWRRVVAWWARVRGGGW